MQLIVTISSLVNNIPIALCFEAPHESNDQVIIIIYKNCSKILRDKTGAGMIKERKLP